MSGVYPLHRFIIQAFVSSFLFFIFSAELHAAWNWTFPFYHAQQQQVLPPKNQETTEEQPVVTPQPQTEPESFTNNVEKPSEQKPEILPAKKITPLPEPASISLKSIPSQPSTVRDAASFDPVSRYSGEVFLEDIQWQGSVLLDGWVTVASQATLTIAPGTIVRVAGNGGIHVLGRIIAKGSPESPILFASLYPEPLAGDWFGIILSGTEKRNVLEHLRIEGADTGLFSRLSSFTAKNFNIHHVTTGVKLQDSVAELFNGRISSAATGLSGINSEADLDAVIFDENRNALSLNASSLSGRDVTLSANRLTGLSAEHSHLRLERLSLVGNSNGARFFSSDGSIVDSVIRNNAETGIILAGSRLKLNGTSVTGNGTGIQSDDNLPLLFGNSIHSNRSYNILYLGEDTFFAGGNWFGPEGSTPLERTIFSKRTGAVHTDPLLKNDPLAKE